MLRIDALRKFGDVVTRLGRDAGPLLNRFQIDPALLANRHAVIPIRAFMQLLEHAASELARPDFGMHLASAQGGGKVLGPLEVAMRNSGTLREAFCYCAQHFQAYSTGTRLRIEEDRAGRVSFLRFELLLARPPHCPQTVEHAVLSLRQQLCELGGGKVRPQEIRFAHAPLSPHSTYREFFGADVRFGQRASGMLLTRRDLELPIPDADPQLHELATSFIEQRFPSSAPVSSTRVRMIVERLLAGGDCTHASVAAVLGMHPRTLQRRLRAEGTSFEAVKDAVRREVALRQLRQPGIPLIRVAQLLGFSSTSVLSRSCRRWFSASPRQLRGGDRSRPSFARSE
jgi:AraC-like DNA-binding protein